MRTSANLLRATALTIMLIATVLPALVSGQIISTVAGGGSPDGYSALGASLPMGGIGFDSSGRLYVATSSRILKVLQEGTFATVAGNGIWGYCGYSGDSDVAANAALSNTDFCVDTNGNVYIADTYINRIRKVSPDGRISTVAGNGISGYSGDGGAATDAQVYQPSGIVVSATGELYFFDSVAIRKITSSGIITTIARFTVTGFGGDGGSAMLAMLNEPRGLAADAHGNVYVADSRNNRIRKIAPNGIISTVAGNGIADFSGDGGPATSAALNYPVAITTDAVGNLYIADVKNNRIRRVAPDGMISTVAGTGVTGFAGDGGMASTAQLNFPGYLAIDPSGDLHFNDGGNGRIRKIARNGMISTVAGNGRPVFVGDGNAAATAFMSLPQNPTIDASGNLYVVDAANFRVRKVSPNGRISTVAGNGIFGFSGDGGDATKANMSPDAVALDAAGNLFVVDSRAERVRKVTPGGVISTVAGGGPPYINGDGGLATDAYLITPYSLAVDAAGNLFIGSATYIRKVTPAGIISTVAGDGVWGFGGDGGPAILARITGAGSLVFDSQGNLHFADSRNFRIRKITPNGVISTVAGDGTFNYNGEGVPATGAIGDISGNMAFDHDGNLFFTDGSNHRVRKITPDGKIYTVAGTGERGSSGDGSDAAGARLNQPQGVTIDAKGDLYVADVFNNRIRKISTRGGANYSDMWWAGSVENGWGMSIEQHADGVQFNTLYVYDSIGKPRWYVMPGGTWSNGFTTYTGQLYQPTGSPLSRYQSSALMIGASVGSATIHFLGNSVGDLSYTIDGIAGKKRLVRMAYGGSDATLDVGDMWWGGNSENGWGISIGQQGGTLFPVWYTYGVDGKSQWLAMFGGSWNNGVYSGLLYTTTGAPWLAAAYNPTALRIEQVGTMSLRFSDSDTATLSYAFASGPFAGISQTKTITRLGF